MKKIVIKIRVFFFLIFCLFSNAQDRDVQSWNNIELTYSPLSNLELALDNGVRVSKNIEEISRCFFDFNIKRKHNNFLSYSFGYRYLFDFNRKDDFLDVNKKKRWYLDGYLKKGLFKRLKFYSRTRFQSQMDSGVASEGDVKNKLRQKCKFVYDFAKSNLDIFMSIEVFFPVDDEIEKIRYQLGLVKPITNKTKLNVNYMIQKYTYSDLLFVIRVKLAHEF